jgi:hypothetical protein
MKKYKDWKSCLRAERNYDNQLSETKVSAENIRIDPNKSPEENCLNCLDKSVDDFARVLTLTCSSNLGSTTLLPSVSRLQGISCFPE